MNDFPPPQPTRRQIPLGAANLRSLLRPFLNYEEERSYYEYCRDMDGEHGVPAGTFVKAAKPLEAIRHYLEIKLAAFLRDPADPPELYCSGPVALSDEEHQTLARLNAWLASNKHPEEGGGSLQTASSQGASRPPETGLKSTSAGKRAATGGSSLWLLSAATDTAEWYETLNDADNGHAYADIRDGEPNPRLDRRTLPGYKAEHDDVFPDLVATVYLPPLWSRRMVEALEQVVPNHHCLIFPARITLKGRRGALPWTHSLVVPTASAAGWFDPERSEAKWKQEGKRPGAGVRLKYPSKIALRDGWTPNAPVMALEGITTHGHVMGVTAEVAQALLAIRPRGVSLVPAEQFTYDHRPSCDGRTDPAEIAAWKKAERESRPNDPVPLTEWQYGEEIFKQLRKDGGMVLHDGGWIERRTDMLHQEWFHHAPDGRLTPLAAEPMLALTMATLAAQRGMAPEAYDALPKSEALADFKSWRKSTRQALRARIESV